MSPFYLETSKMTLIENCINEFNKAITQIDSNPYPSEAEKYIKRQCLYMISALKDSYLSNVEKEMMCRQYIKKETLDKFKM